MSPKFLRVLYAMSNGAPVSLDEETYALCHQRESDAMALAFQTSDKEGNKLWIEACHWGLNDFIEFCETLSEDDIAAMGASSPSIVMLDSPTE